MNYSLKIRGQRQYSEMAFDPSLCEADRAILLHDTRTSDLASQFYEEDMTTTFSRERIWNSDPRCVYETVRNKAQVAASVLREQGVTVHMCEEVKFITVHSV
jgi:hypothetical protein